MANKKIKKIKPMKSIIARLKARGKKVVFTNGCFDILHVGHIRYLKRAKKQGDFLVIGLNTDHSVKQIKGEERPIVPEKERAEVLSSLEFVDYVVLFDEPDPFLLIEYLKPNVLVKGADWPKNKIIGREIMEKTGAGARGVGPRYAARTLPNAGRAGARRPSRRGHCRAARPAALIADLPCAASASCRACQPATRRTPADLRG